jgi:hypothetical protein
MAGDGPAIVLRNWSPLVAVTLVSQPTRAPPKNTLSRPTPKQNKTKQVFDKVDVNNNNTIEAIEAEVAILSLYNVVNKRVPGKCTAPRKKTPPAEGKKRKRRSQKNALANKKTNITGWQDPPTRARIMESLKTCDKDGDGALNKEEFFSA